MPLIMLCSNCGHREAVNDDAARRKVRCPQCGVLCPVTEGTAPKAQPSATEDDEALARRLLDEVEEPAPKPAPRRAVTAAPPKPRPKPAPTPTPAPALPRPTSDEEDDDDGKPYIVVGGEERRCSQCQRVIDQEAVLCIHCGHDFKQGKKRVRTYDPLERGWDLGMSLQSRWKMFIGLSVLGIVCSVIVTLVSGEPWQRFITPMLLFMVMLALIVGSFFRAVLTRDSKGRVKLMRTWYIGFVARPPSEVDLLQYEGVRLDMGRDGGKFEWFLCIILLCYLIVPGVLWWYHVIFKDRWIVVLTRDHGQSHEALYRGNDGALAKVVVATLRDAGGLREERN